MDIQINIEDKNEIIQSKYSLSSPPPLSSSSSSLSSSTIQQNYCFRLRKWIIHSFLLNYFLPIILIILLIIVFYLCKDYAKSMLYWIETQNIWFVFCIFILLFSVVSFPITIGYLALIISSGYLFGILKGLLTVILGANVGVIIAHNIIKSVQSKLPIQRIIKNETSKAILRVIAGPRAFKVVLLARLTPIPFGLQNTIFGVSNINSKSYHMATLLGLLPAQTINVYIGSTLRSMHEVLHEHNTALASYTVFAVQVFIGIILMIYVIQKAKNELSEALLSEFNGNHNDDVEV